MCVGIPSKIVSLNGEMAVIEVYGVQKEVSVVLLDDLSVGDYVIVHAGFALNKIDEAEAEEILRLFDTLLADQEEM